MQNESDVKRDVRAIVLAICSPLKVHGRRIKTADDVEPAWDLGPQFPVGLDSTTVDTFLVAQLDDYVRTVRPAQRFRSADIKKNMTIGDLQDVVWDKVKA